MASNFNAFPYPFFVEYIDNSTGEQCFDTWSTDTLNTELARGEVTIIHVELAYNVQVALGLADED